MDIETFVRDTITGIVRGVAGAQTATAGDGARINPRIRSEGKIVSGHNRPVSEVRFSVAVTAEDVAHGHGGIKVLGISAGGDGSTTQEHTSRVEFTVPVCWPISRE